mmetsp:Transcript_28873/g.62171  ORF Transcript_28873/g.62171 Transcript_28873/m.62171 type:complete len:218 (-) Transcript_28873:5398-6051(-)
MLCLVVSFIKAMCRMRSSGQTASGSSSNLFPNVKFIVPSQMGLQNTCRGSAAPTVTLHTMRSYCPGRCRPDTSVSSMTKGRGRDALVGREDLRLPLCSVMLLREGRRGLRRGGATVCLVVSVRSSTWSSLSVWLSCSSTTFMLVWNFSSCSAMPPSDLEITFFSSCSSRSSELAAWSRRIALFMGNHTISFASMARLTYCSSPSSSSLSCSQTYMMK